MEKAEELRRAKIDLEDYINWQSRVIDEYFAGLRTAQSVVSSLRRCNRGLRKAEKKVKELERVA